MVDRKSSLRSRPKPICRSHVDSVWRWCVNSGNLEVRGSAVTQLGVFVWSQGQHGLEAGRQLDRKRGASAVLLLTRGFASGQYDRIVRQWIFNIAAGLALWSTMLSLCLDHMQRHQPTPPQQTTTSSFQNPRGLSQPWPISRQRRNAMSSNQTI